MESALHRWGWFVAALALAFGLAVFALQTPDPVGPRAPAETFSAVRAMADVRALARAPHPVGSAEHARVREHLARRLQALGLATEVQTGPLSAAASRRLAETGGPRSAREIMNVIGVLPGTDPAADAVLIMAHYDTTPRSPGAADDSAGVAAALEATRAIRARGPVPRTLIVLLTDAEELDLGGARLFFDRHPLRRRAAFVVNLEARGGGGRAIMFETGSGNAATVRAFGAAAARAAGGPSSNSLAVLVYRLMPNDTDFTVVRRVGAAGVNLAFLGRPGQYHSPRSTPHALEQGSVQHLGSQALEIADAALRAPTLPRRTHDLVYADIFGLKLVAYPPLAGWALLAGSFVLGLLAAWRTGSLSPRGLAEVGRGALDAIWFAACAAAMLPAVRLAAGSAGFESPAWEAYSLRLARLGGMEAAALLALLLLAVALAAGRARLGRIAPATVLLASALACALLDAFDVLTGAALALALALSALPGLAARSAQGASLGLLAFCLGLATIAQALAPEAAFLWAWPSLLAAAGLAAAAALAGGRARRLARAPAFLVAAVGCGWLGVLAHGLFLGVGADLPQALALVALPALMLLRPLAPWAARPHTPYIA